MTEWPIEQLGCLELAKFLSQDFDSAWNTQDGAAALRFQLGAPLAPDILSTAIDSDGERLRMLLERYQGPREFGSQLVAESPCIDLLIAIKYFAKNTDGVVANPLSRNGATVLYFAAIASAFASGQGRISQLSDERLEEGFMWAKRCEGAESLAGLFDRALARLHAS